MAPPLLSMLGAGIKSVAIDEARLEIEIVRNTLDWIWTETWIFRRDTPP